MQMSLVNLDLHAVLQKTFWIHDWHSETPVSNCNNELEFRLCCDVSDHTGTLTRVWASNSLVKSLLGGAEPLDYLQIAEEAKTRVRFACRLT